MARVDLPSDGDIAAFVDRLLAQTVLPSALSQEARHDFIAHLEADVERRVRAGVAHHDAVQAALAAFGSPTDIGRALLRASTECSRAAGQRAHAGAATARQERSRRYIRVVVEGPTRMRAAMDEWRRDIWYACRSLRHRPLSSAAAVATLAIGIGLNAATFSILDWVLLRPLPYPAADELVRVFTATVAEVSEPADLRYAEFVALARAPAFRTSTAYSVATRVMSGPGLDPAHVAVARVAGDLFGTFGVTPQIGRSFNDDEVASGAAIVVLSGSLWRQYFAADPAIVGRVITIDGRPHTVAGVMPVARGYPRDADLWRPLTAEEHEDDDRDHTMIGRLVDPQGAEQASVELSTLVRGASEGTRTGWVEDVHRSQVRDVRITLVALVASTALILLMACANVATLLGARAAERSGEMAVRGAMGASRARLVRQLLTESVILALVGGAAGFVLGRWTLDLLVMVAPAELPRLAEIALDRRIMGVGVAVTLIVGIAVGLAPAYGASRVDLRAGIERSGSRSSRRAGRRQVLVAAQTAVAVVLTMGAMLLARSLQHVVYIDHGFAPERLVAVNLYLRTGVAGDVRQFLRELVQHAEAVPGVTSAAVALRLPTELGGFRTGVRIDGVVIDKPVTVMLRPVTREYFDTTGIRLLAGRGFTQHDTPAAARVGLVNAAFVRSLLGGVDPVGRRATTDVFDGSFAIAGVVADITPAGERDRPALYVSMDQVSVAGGSLLVRTAGDPASLVPTLRSRLRAVAPTLALDRIRVVTETLEAGRAVTRFNTRLAAAFAGLALLLAGIGLYGLTAGEVIARWREIAVRLALGAPRHTALWTIVRPAATALLIGVGLGLGVSLGLGRWTAALLQGVTPADLPTMMAVPLLLLVVALIALSLAAARVLRADPAATLRGD